MASSPKLSGLIVAHNEQEMIEDALRSLSFCDEIVVCLDRCTDETKSIVEKYTDLILEGGEKEEWHIEGKRRNAGLAKCSGDWILELDADERVSDDAMVEIREAIGTVDEGYFVVPIDNYVGDRLVKYGWAGSFGTTAVARLFLKGGKVWGDQRVHPKVDLKGTKRRLTKPLIHLVDKDIDDMIDRLQRYTTAHAQDMASSGELPRFRTSLRKGMTRFYKSYWARKGYKEGRMGFLLALMAMMFIVISHIKAEVEMMNQENLS